MSLVASGTEPLTELLARLYPPKVFDLRSAFDAALSPAGMPEGEGEDDDDGSGDDGGDDGSGSSGDGDGGDDSVIKDPDKKKLSDEAAKHRTRANAEKERADKAEAELRKIQDKDKSDLEKAQRDLEEVTKERDTLKAENTGMKLQVEFSLKHASKFKDAETALMLLEKNKDVLVNDSGEVEGMDKGVEALLKSKPHLAADAESDGDDGDGKPPSGGTNNGKRNKDKDLQKETLVKKFPALRR